VPPPPTPSPARRVVGEATPSAAAAVEGVQLNDVTDRDILIVVSKMKKYIKERSGMNCSDAIADVLSEHVRVLCDDCIRAAARDERKTVLERDVPRPRR
jgi:histone H3/H4